MARLDFRALLRDDALGRAREPAPTLTKQSAFAATATMPRAVGSAPGILAAPQDGAAARAGLSRNEDPLDPLSRHHASLAPPEMQFSPPAPVLAQPLPPCAGATPSEVPAARAAASLEDLLPALVRRVAWSGDGKRGTMRLELGAGELAGSTLLVHADAGRVRVELAVPAGTSAAGWQDRIRERLAQRGIPTDSVEVT
jgi:hypothetical protein